TFRIRLLLISCGIILFRPDIPRQHRRRKDACQKKSRGPFPFSSDRSHNHPSVLDRPVSWSRPFSQYSLLEKSCQFKLVYLSSAVFYSIVKDRKSIFPLPIKIKYSGLTPNRIL